MTLGNLVAIVQRDVKRMLAYSAVAQAGYIAVGFAAFTTDGIAAALFYGLLYLLMNAAAFLVVARVAADGSNPSLDDLRGLHRRSPLLAATLLLALFALAGVPPTAGFIGKWFLFRAAMLQGWWWLVLLGAINSTVSVYYYLIVVKHAYLLPAEQERPIVVTAADKAACYALCAGLVVLGILSRGGLRLGERRGGGAAAPVAPESAVYRSTDSWGAGSRERGALIELLIPRERSDRGISRSAPPAPPAYPPLCSPMRSSCTSLGMGSAFGTVRRNCP